MDSLLLKQKIGDWAKELGFSAVRIAKPEIGHENRFLYQQWLEKGYAGSMHYLIRNSHLRYMPQSLFPGTKSILMVRMDYFSHQTTRKNSVLGEEQFEQGRYKAKIARYAAGRDYHRVIRKRLSKLAEKITAEIGLFEYRAFSDSAPIMEVDLAQQSGLGWRGKNTLLLSRTGSWFFLGCLFLPIYFEPDTAIKSHCGSCSACLEQCPTKAFIKPYVLDATRCISYLTIESKASIPTKLREAMGQYIFGCDICQEVCPWNRHATSPILSDFFPKKAYSEGDLIAFFNWSESNFREKTAGSAIRRISYDQWLRNIAIGLGNSQPSIEIIELLRSKRGQVSVFVQEHIDWAIAQQKTNFLRSF